VQATLVAIESLVTPLDYREFLVSSESEAKEALYRFKTLLYHLRRANALACSAYWPREADRKDIEGK
jgi:hypothetical protein